MTPAAPALSGRRTGPLRHTLTLALLVLAIAAFVTNPLRDSKAAPDAAPSSQPPPGQTAVALPPEALEVDASTRTIEIRSDFTGTQIVFFGTVLNSRQTSAEAGYYDIVMVVEGRGAPSMVRRKSNVAGLWVNTRSVRFDNLPLYSGISTTRPLDEIADQSVLDANVIGFNRAALVPANRASLSVQELENFKAAAIRLKRAQGLFATADYGVAFIGPALFRATVSLPANIPVGPLTARIFLFHDGKLLAAQRAQVMLERQGIDRFVHDFASMYPLWYGVLTVIVSSAAALGASFIFRRRS